jgi:hypothetical protein
MVERKQFKKLVYFCDEYVALVLNTGVCVLFTRFVLAVYQIYM